MLKVIQTQPAAVSEKTALIKTSSSSSSISTTASITSFSELNLLTPINSFRISRHKERICCNFTRKYHAYDDSRRDELLLIATQESGCCSNDYEDMLIYDLHEQHMFTIESEEATGYFTTQIKFPVTSFTQIGIGSVLRVWGFMESPRYEIRNWDDEHLFCIGPPTVSGIKSYDRRVKYEVISNDGRVVSTFVQESSSVFLKFDEAEPLQPRSKTLILALGFILDLMRNEEP